MINYKKIMSLAASALMFGSTLTGAMAATYPAPFVQDGTAAGAVVVGANAAPSDWAAAIDLSQSLSDMVTTSSGTTDATITGGNAAELFTSSTKIYINDSLNVVKNALTESELPTILADGSFSGNVDATYTQTITLGSYPIVTYAKQPTSSDDPVLGLATSSSTGNEIYNTTVTFNKAVNLSHADSEGEDITLFGQRFTIAAATTPTSLVLLKEAEKLSLDSETNPSQEVTIGGETYTVELVSASDTSITIKVTDSSGASDSREVDEAASKKIQGLTVAVQTADETNLKLSGTIIAGAEKVTLTNGSSVTIGEDDTVIDGTKATLTGNADSLTKLVIQVSATSSDTDAITPGNTFTDPVFGSFKMDFAGLNIEETSASREEFVIGTSGDDKLELTMTDSSDGTATVQWAINISSGMALQVDEDRRNITVL